MINEINLVTQLNNLKNDKIYQINILITALHDNNKIPIYTVQVNSHPKQSPNILRLILTKTPLLFNQTLQPLLNLEQRRSRFIIMSII